MDDLSLSNDVSREGAEDKVDVDEPYRKDWQDETAEITNDRIYLVTSLQNLCMQTIVTDYQLVQIATDCVPSKIHCMLFTSATELVPVFGDDLRKIVAHLVSTWPLPTFRLKDLLPENRINNILHPTTAGATSNSLLTMVSLGLLNLTADCKLRTADFTGITAPCVFQLPLLFMPKEERVLDIILRKFQEKCKIYGVEDFSDSLEAVLSWRLGVMSNLNTHHNFRAEGPVDILIDSSMDLGDCMSNEEEIIGLTLQEASPFNIKIRKMAIYNFTVKQTGILRWILSSTDLKAMDKLVLYGGRKGIQQIMYLMHKEFKQLTQLTKVDIGVAYPTLATFIGGENMPKKEEILVKNVEVLNHWSNIVELYFIGVVLTNNLKYWFSALENPLQVVNLHACYLTSEDFLYLAHSHHVQTLTELGLDKNKLGGSASALCEVLHNTKHLNIFSVIDTNLTEQEKASLMAALQHTDKLHTVLVYENEDMISPDGYSEIVGLACAIRPLRSLYVFPFNYKPFEKLYRPTVMETCELILAANNRKELMLGF